MKALCYTLLTFVGLLASGARGEQVTVAVATNFFSTMTSLEALFETSGQHELTAVGGSTGQLYAQALNGAPYDVFLAADQSRPARLTEEGLAVGDTQFTYALGRLVLWTREPSLAASLSLELLAGSEFRRLAIANPLLAPYGVAAEQTLASLDLWAALQPRIVRGENIGQAFAMVETRNAELGLVALSSALAYADSSAHVVVPSNTYEPIRQDAILLTRGRENRAALAFMRFLRDPQARRIIDEAGYSSP